MSYRCVHPLIATDAKRALSMMNPGSEFEIQVRRIARNLWPSAGISSSTLVDGNEIDGMFVTDEIVFLIEATIERTRRKIEGDYKKLELKRDYLRGKYPDHVFRGFIVTRDDPTAEQMGVIPANRSWVRVMSFRTFFSKLVDADQYLHLRANAPFGSASDPFTGSKQLSNMVYVPTPYRQKGQSKVYSNQEIVSEVASPTPRRFLIAGDFGVGKSFGLREIFRGLEAIYKAGSTFRFPVFINLRDHQGQTDPDEVLARHARRIGFDQQQLVRAWRGDCVSLILDGFDELVAAGWSDFVKTGADARRSACEIVRKFISESAASTPILLSGRESYFDSPAEMLSVLSAASFIHINLDEFSAEQAIEYVSKTLKLAKSDIFLPAWLPHKPLLLGYCAARGVLAKAQNDSDAIVDDGEGWDWLLDQISTREAETSGGVDPSKIRSLMEQIALQARRHLDPLGSIDVNSMERAFGQVFGKLPDPQVRKILDRMPGLTWGDQSGTRRFIDEHFFSAAQAGSVHSFIQSPHQVDLESFRNTQQCIGPISARVAYSRCRKVGSAHGVVMAALDVAATKQATAGNLAGDVLQVLLNYEEVSSHKSKLITISAAYFEELEFEPELFRNVSVHFDNCLFGELALGELVEEQNSISFSSCEISKLTCSPRTQAGWVMIADKKTKVGNFQAFSTTNDAIMNSSLPLGFRILKTILRKIFQQSGGGRVEGALFRGIGQVPHDQIRQILYLVEQHGLASPNRASKNVTWHANRTQANRAAALIDAFNVPDDVVAKSSVKLLPAYPSD